MRRLLLAMVMLVAICRTDAAESNASTGAQETVRLPGVTILGGATGSVVAAGQVCLTNGILEFVAVETGGREYESLFSLQCKPSALQFALLLIGAQTGAVPAEAKSPAEVGSRLVLEVEWTQQGKTQRAPVERFLLDRKTRQPARPLEWIFTGSFFGQDFRGRTVFLADEEQAHIALWLQPAIPINVSGDFGNPYRAEDAGFEVNSATVPPLGTPIKLIIRRRPD